MAPSPANQPQQASPSAPSLNTWITNEDRLRAEERRRLLPPFQRLRTRYRAQDMAAEREHAEEAFLTQYLADHPDLHLQDAFSQLTLDGQIGEKSASVVRREEIARASATKVRSLLDRGNARKAAKLAERICFQRDMDPSTEHEVRRAVAGEVIEHLRNLGESGKLREFIAASREVGIYARVVHGHVGLDNTLLQSQPIQAAVTEELVRRAKQGVAEYRKALGDLQRLSLVPADERTRQEVLDALREEAIIRAHDKDPLKRYVPWCKAWEDAGVIRQGSYNRLPEIRDLAFRQIIEGVPTEMSFGTYESSRDRWIKAGVVTREECNGSPEVRNLVKERLLGALRSEDPHRFYSNRRKHWEIIGVLAPGEANAWPEVIALAFEEAISYLPYEASDKAYSWLRDKWVKDGPLSAADFNERPEVKEFADKEVIKSVRRGLEAFTDCAAVWERAGVGTKEHFNSLPDVKAAAQDFIGRAYHADEERMKWVSAGVQL